MVSIQIQDDKDTHRCIILRILFGERSLLICEFRMLIKILIIIYLSDLKIVESKVINNSYIYILNCEYFYVTVMRREKSLC